MLKFYCQPIQPLYTVVTFNDPGWLWQGDSCRVRYLSPAQIETCFDQKNMSLVVYGDSLANEIGECASNNFIPFN